MIENEQSVGELPGVPARKLTLYEQLESGGLASLASMEGAWGDWEESAPEQSAETSSMLGGIMAAASVMVVAWFVHQLPFAPFTLEGGALEHPIGVSVLAILFGIVVANVVPRLDLRMGCRWITTWCIPAAIVMLGARMDWVMLSSVSWGLLASVVAIMIVAVAVSYGVGRMLGMSNRASYLLGVGTAVCGSSAILAVAPVAGADDEEVVVTVGVVNLVGLLAMFFCVSVLWWMPLDAGLFGSWAGSTIHAVPQVVAAGESHGTEAAAMATLVKLTRVTMLVPVVLLSALLVARLADYKSNQKTAEGGHSPAEKRPLWQYVPWFVWGFVILSGLRALGCLPSLEFHPNGGETVTVALSEGLPIAAKWLLALSMAAIGLQVQLRPMLKAGAKAFLAGAIAWACMCVFAFFLLRAVLA